MPSIQQILYIYYSFISVFVYLLPEKKMRKPVATVHCIMFNCLLINNMIVIAITGEISNYKYCY